MHFIDLVHVKQLCSFFFFLFWFGNVLFCIVCYYVWIPQIENKEYSFNLYLYNTKSRSVVFNVATLMLRHISNHVISIIFFLYLSNNLNNFYQFQNTKKYKINPTPISTIKPTSYLCLSLNSLSSSSQKKKKTHHLPTKQIANVSPINDFTIKSQLP